MLTKTKIALAALLVAGSASLAAAQEADPNLLNRYPSYNGVNGAGDSVVVIAPRSFQAAPQGTFRSAPVGLNTDRTYVGGGTGGTAWTANDGRAQVQSFHYDSAPLQGGAGG